MVQQEWRCVPSRVTHASIERESAPGIPRVHRFGVFTLEQPTPGECTQEAAAHLGLYVGDGFGADAADFAKVRAAGLQNRLDHDSVRSRQSEKTDAVGVCRNEDGMRCRTVWTQSACDGLILSLTPTG